MILQKQCESLFSFSTVLKLNLRTENTLLTKGFEIRKIGVLRTPDRLRRVQFQSDWSGSNSPHENSSKKGQFAPRQRWRDETKAADGSTSPYELPRTEEFGLRFNQMNEFIRFGDTASGSTARVVKCLRFDGEEISVYALKVNFALSER
jgi:hypothetical protein